ncbi:unnamed protein product [Musa textilis]
MVSSGPRPSDFRVLSGPRPPFIPNCGSVAMVSSEPRPSDSWALAAPRPLIDR